MDCRAGVFTGTGTAALATLRVIGRDAEPILDHLLTPAPPPPGRHALCHVQDNAGRIDQIVVGHETAGTYALHCHGNPLIAERILACLRDRGARLVEGEDLLPTRGTFVEHEIDRALGQTRTLRGASLVSAQRDHGLLPLLRRWQDDVSLSLPTVQGQCQNLLGRYPPGRTLLEGCRVMLVGPPNSGKSTLFNRLLGIDKSIVAEVEGTTRDWVDGDLTLPDLHLHLFDTPGLDSQLAQQAASHLDRAAQDQALALLNRADFYLLVLDNSQSAAPDPLLPLDKLPASKTLVALNKNDLPTRLDAGVYQRYAHLHRISAAQDSGLAPLIDGIRSLSGVKELDIRLPTPFTSRQSDLLTALMQTTRVSQAQSLVHELLFGPRGTP